MGRSIAKVHVLSAVTAVVLGGCGFRPSSPMLEGTGGAGPPDAGGPGAAGTTGFGGAPFGVPTGDAGATGSGGASGALGTSNPDSNCAATSQGAVPLPPDILIIQDKSGSMDGAADGSCTRNCGANSKWSQVTTALNQVVTMTDTTVNWGLKFFATSNNSCTTDANVEVPIGPANGTAIAAAITAARTGSPTPTRLAENAGAMYMASLTDANPKYLLLATDGLPNCDPSMPTMTNADDSAGAEQAVTDAFNMGLPTFVVGIGDTMGTATLNQMALNGGVPQMGAATSFYAVSDTTSLVDVLNTILGQVASCKFDIGAAPNSHTSNDYIDVFGDGVPIPQDTTHTDGWDYTNAAHTAIEVYGPRCDAVMAGTIMTVTVTFRCIIG